MRIQIVAEIQSNHIEQQHPGISHSVMLPNAIPSLDMDEIILTTTVHI